MRDFGIVDEATVAGVGLNAKLSDVHAAFGLLALPGVEQEIAGRRRVAQAYEAGLAGVPGLRTLGRAADPDWNCAYFPVRIDAARFGMNRDRVHAELRQMNVNARRYFMPLCSRIPPYDRLPSAQPARLPNAVRVADEVLCLPLFGDLDLATATVIAGALRTLHEKADA
jgi:dTDP-4-amino-4,6-dideoxygalactose transaminase